MGGWNASSLWTGGPKEKTVKKSHFYLLKVFQGQNYYTLGIV